MKDMKHEVGGVETKIKDATANPAVLLNFMRERTMKSDTSNRWLIVLGGILINLMLGVTNIHLLDSSAIFAVHLLFIF